MATHVRKLLLTAPALIEDVAGVTVLFVLLFAGLTLCPAAARSETPLTSASLCCAGVFFCPSGQANSRSGQLSVRPTLDQANPAMASQVASSASRIEAWRFL
jgi:hypothetical protein